MSGRLCVIVNPHKMQTAGAAARGGRFFKSVPKKIYSLT